MGLAIPVMHYVGMAAVTFTPAPLTPPTWSTQSTCPILASRASSLVTFMLLGLVLLTALLDRRFSLQDASAGE